MANPINIECEIRSFLTDEQYDRLSEKLGRVAMYGGEDEQITYYFKGNGDPDLRIQKNGTGTKIWLKKGLMHDEARHEIEVHCEAGAFGALEELFLALGYDLSIKWFRKRRTYKFDGITISLDDTRGYGKIIELELMCFDAERAASLEKLNAAMRELGIEATPKEEFKARYARYRENWRELTGEA